MSLSNKLRSRNEKENPAIVLVTALFMMYIISGILLLLLALILFKMEPGEMVIKIAVILIYIVSGIAGGFFMGRKLKDRKFLWGLLAGSTYFFLLCLLSLIVKQGVDMEAAKVITTCILCAASGMAGGMVS